MDVYTIRNIRHEEHHLIQSNQDSAEKYGVSLTRMGEITKNLEWYESIDRKLVHLIYLAKDFNIED